MKRLMVPLIMFIATCSFANGKGVIGFQRQLFAIDSTSTHVITQGANEFAFDLLRKLELQNKDKNIFFSPFSISDAFAMTYAGARGETEKQMAHVLHITLPQGKFQPAFSSLINKINVKEGGKLYKLKIANALWGQKGYKFLPDFIDLINKYYEGGFFTVDFVKHKIGAIKTINAWVEDKTEDKIKNLITKGDINRLTRLVLTNAIYFKGNWALKFKTENTKALPFYVSSKKPVEVPMMYQKGEFSYFKGKGLQALELSYVGKKLSMIILLPSREVGIEGIEKQLTEKNFSFYLSHLHKRTVQIYLPKFKLKTRYYLGKVLSSMGMPDAFSNDADFSGMTGNKELKISKVVHEAYINVNEEGTEAAAATAVVMQLKAVMINPVFRADHPFIFLIVDKETGSILFMGKVVNPEINQ